MPATDLRLLALDGGGIRGLSSLMILRRLMVTVDPDALPKPCDYFDMIGGTNTGGLIAIILGRLRMTVDECIDAYTTLSDRVFEKKSHRVTIKGRLQGRFNSAELERAVKTIVVNRDLGENTVGSPTATYPQYHRRKRLQLEQVEAAGQAIGLMRSAGGLLLLIGISQLVLWGITFLGIPWAIP